MKCSQTLTEYNYRPLIAFEWPKTNTFNEMITLPAGFPTSHCSKIEISQINQSLTKAFFLHYKERNLFQPLDFLW